MGNVARKGSSTILILAVLALIVPHAVTTAVATPAPLAPTGPDVATIDVRAYGAAGDGRKDDAAAIKSAVDACCDTGGGIVHFPPGEYVIDSDTVGGYSNHVLANIDASGVTILGAPGCKLVVSKSTPICLFFARNVNNVRIEGIHAVGNSSGSPSSLLGTFFWADNRGASADVNDITVERCILENFQSGEWINFMIYGDYSMRNTSVQNCQFYSRSGNMPRTGGSGVPASCVRWVADAEATGYHVDIEIHGCYADCYYIKNFAAFRGRVRYARAHHNVIEDAGAGKATDSVQSYAILAAYDSATSHIYIHDNTIINPWTCGVYSVSGDNLCIQDNYIEGQLDANDSTLNLGGIAAGFCTNLRILGNEIVDCAVGIEIQPETLCSANLIDGVHMRNCGTKGIVVRESSVWANTGGVTITNCQLDASTIRVYESTALGNLGNIRITNNFLERGYIWCMTSIYGGLIAGNTVLANDQSYGIRIGGPSSIVLRDNQVWGPGYQASASYGIHLNTHGLYPSVIEGNTITAFETGLYAPYGAATLRDNVFSDCLTLVSNSVAGDLGRENPATIPGSVTTYWSAGQFVENIGAASSPGVEGWWCVGPLMGWAAPTLRLRRQIWPTVRVLSQMSRLSVATSLAQQSS